LAGIAGEFVQSGFEVRHHVDGFPLIKAMGVVAKNILDFNDGATVTEALLALLSPA